MRIEHGLVPARGPTERDQPLRRGATAGRADRARPDEASRAQLGDLHEEMGTEALREEEARRGFVGGNSARMQRPEVVDARG